MANGKIDNPHNMPKLKPGPNERYREPRRYGKWDTDALPTVTPVTDTPASLADTPAHTEGVTTPAPISDADTLALKLIGIDLAQPLLPSEYHEDCDCPSCLGPYY